MSRVPITGPTVDTTQHISLDLTEDPICNIYGELGEKFKEKLLSVVSDFVHQHSQKSGLHFISQNSLEICIPSAHEFTSTTYL